MFVAWAVFDEFNVVPVFQPGFALLVGLLC
jgi:hypothetical protein